MVWNERQNFRTVPGKLDKFSTSGVLGWILEFPEPEGGGRFEKRAFLEGFLSASQRQGQGMQGRLSRNPRGQKLRPGPSQDSAATCGPVPWRAVGESKAGRIASHFGFSGGTEELKSGNRRYLQPQSELKLLAVG